MTKKLSQLIVAGSLLLLGSTSFALISEQTEQAAISLGAADIAEVEFVPGSDTLSDAGRAEVRNLVEDAKQKGKLDHINVMAWSDQEYPAEKTSQSKASISLAKRRLANVKKYINSELKVSNVESFNMAERPGKLKEIFNTPDAKVKKTAEVAGAAPVKDSETGLFGEKSQASKAVLMIFLKK